MSVCVVYAQDKASVESCCLCFSRLVENFITQPVSVGSFITTTHDIFPTVEGATGDRLSRPIAQYSAIGKLPITSFTHCLLTPPLPPSVGDITTSDQPRGVWDCCQNALTSVCLLSTTGSRSPQAGLVSALPSVCYDNA